MQRTPDGALGERPVGRPGAPTGGRKVGRDDRIERGSAPLDALEIILQQLEAADLAPAHRARELLRRPEMHVEHDRPPRCPAPDCRSKPALSMGMLAGARPATYLVRRDLPCRADHDRGLPRAPF